MTKKKKKDYIDEVKFEPIYRKFKEDREIDPDTPWPPYILECFMKLIDGMGNNPGFYNYTYLDEMKADAMIPLLKYGTNFDPDKGYKAFSYYSMIVSCSFIQRIKKEARQTEIKQRYLLHNFSLNSDLFIEDGDDSIDSLHRMIEMVDDKRKAKKEKKKK